MQRHRIARAAPAAQSAASPQRGGSRPRLSASVPNHRDGTGVEPRAQAATKAGRSAKERWQLELRLLSQRQHCDVRGTVDADRDVHGANATTHEE